MDDLKMTLEEMISALDGAGGRLIIASLHDPVIREAHEMIIKVSLALGEVEELTYADYGDDDDSEEEDEQ